MSALGSDLRVLYEGLQRQALSVETAKTALDTRREVFAATARRARLAKYGEGSLRYTAKRLEVSAAFLSQFETGTRWSDVLAARIVKLYL